MENASKALLIAAAVLVVIILVAVGMKIYSSTTGAQKVGLDTGTTINDKTKEATDIATSAIQEKEYSKKIDIKELTVDNYGDYLDLGKSIVGTSSSADDWRIIYNDKSEKKVYAILADLLPNGTGINASAGFQTTGVYQVYLNRDSNNDNLLSILKDRNKWKELLSSNLQGNKKLVVQGGITDSKLLSSYKERHNDSSITSYSKLDNSDTLYFPNSNHNGCAGYWIASYNNVYYIKNLWSLSFYFSKMLYDYNYSDTNNGIRPVVILDYNTKIISKGTGLWSIAE